jgi:hypothetical protein
MLLTEGEKKESIFKGNQGSKAPKAPRSVAPKVLSLWNLPLIDKNAIRLLSHNNYCFSIGSKWFGATTLRKGLRC